MSFVKNVLGLLKTAKQGSGGIDRAVRAYEEGGTLEEVLTAFSSKTEQKIDDAAAKAVVDSLGRVSNLLFNLGEITEGISYEIRDLRDVLDKVKKEPLMHILDEEKDHG